jgi:hypothetical protein
MAEVTFKQHIFLGGYREVYRIKVYRMIAYKLVSGHLTPRLRFQGLGLCFVKLKI